MEVVIGFGVMSYIAAGTAQAYWLLKKQAKECEVTSSDVVGCFGANILAWPIISGVIVYIQAKELLDNWKPFAKIAAHFNKGQKGE